MTFREKIAKNDPLALDTCYMGGVKGCPYSYDYEPKDARPCKGRENTICDKVCTACWDREIPGTEPTNLHYVQNEEENNMPTKKTNKTKAELMEELESVKNAKEELEKEIKDLEKYKQYEDMAGEVHAIYMAYIHAGFSEEQAYDLLKTMIQNASNITFNTSVTPSYRSHR